MSAPAAGDPAPGVYRRAADGTLSPVHRYLDDGYELADVNELLSIGTLRDGGTALELTRAELRLLKVTADAESFDHGEAFIGMCLDIARVDPGPDVARVLLVSVG